MPNNLNLPLSGVKVVELATVVAAPVASRLLCEYGAEVIKVETLSGDGMRGVGNVKGVPASDVSNPAFTLANSGKEFISINIKKPEGKDMLFKLLEDADVFISNVRLNSLKKQGLDYESIKDRFPHLIYAHFSGFGPKGPDSGNPGYDSTAFWLKPGMQSDWQVEGVPPFLPTFAFGDYATSSALFGGIVTALYAKTKNGKGTYLETSLYGTGIWYNSFAVMQLQAGMEKLNPETETRLEPLSGTYKCQDGVYVGLYATNYPRGIASVAKVLDIEWILEDERFTTEEKLMETKSYTELYHILCDAFMKKPAKEWRDLMVAANVAMEMFHSAKDVPTDPQAIENGYIEEVKFEDGREFMMPVPPMMFNNYDRRPYTTHAGLAADTDMILKNAGYTDDQIKDLKAKGVIE